MKRKMRILALVLAAAVLLCSCGRAEPEKKSEDKEPRITYAVPLSYQAPTVPLENWQGAKWIWADADTGVNTHGEFRRTFVLETLPESALVQIACDNKYWMRVNGHSVTVEGGLNRGPNEYDTYYDLLDIAHYLTEGENVLEILAWYWGETSHMTHYITSGTPGLIVSTDFGVQTGDGQWLARVHPAYKTGGELPNMYLGEYCEVYDARLESDEGWQPAIPAAEEAEAGSVPWGNLILRPTPQHRDFGLTEVPVEEAEVTAEEGKTVYRLTLPYNMQVFPYIAFGADTPAGTEVVMYTETVDNSKLTSTYITRDGEQTFESKLWMNGDCLYFALPEGAQVEMLGYRQTGYGIDTGTDTLYLGSFNSVLQKEDATIAQFTGGHSWSKEEADADNNFYDELWQKAADTLYVSLRDSYMDCPDRERGQYIGDVLNELEEAFYCLGPSANAITAKAIRQLCAGQEVYEYKGETYFSMSSLEPFPSTHEIQVQALGTAVAAYKYWLYTGDATLPADTWQALYNYLTNFTFMTSGEYAGTIRVRQDKELMQTHMMQNGSLGSWSDWGDNQDIRIAFTCWWYMSAKAVRQLAAAEGVQATQDQLLWLDAGMKQVEDNFEKFWNEELRAYATKWDSRWYNKLALEDRTHLVDDRVNALAVVSGLAKEEHYGDIRNIFMGTDTTPAYRNASIYMERYVIEALYTMGCAEDAMVRLAQRHMDIVNDATSSTLPELWVYSAGMSSTKNHGWSGGGLIALSRFASGIEPTDVGYASYRIKPQMGNFAEIATLVPAQIGDIGLKLSKTTEGGLVMEVTLPQGNCEVWVPTKENQTVTPSGGSLLPTQDGYTVYLVETPGTYIFTVQ